MAHEVVFRISQPQYEALEALHASMVEWGKAKGHPAESFFTERPCLRLFFCRTA